MSEEKQIQTVKTPMQIKDGELVFRDSKDLVDYATYWCQSGLVPSHFNTPAKLLYVWAAGNELGIGKWQATQQMFCINGKVGLSGSLMLGLIAKKTGGNVNTYFDGKPYEDDYTAVVESDRGKGVRKTTFSVLMAKTAGIWKSNTWAKYPDDMLLWRAVSRHARLYYSDILCGMYTDDELREIPSEPEPQDKPRSSVLFEQEVEEMPPAKPDIPDSPAIREAELAEVESFSQPVPEEPRECRYLCNNCSNEFDTPSGKKNKLCPSCLSANILDRQNKGEAA